MTQYLWIIPSLPIAGFLVLALFGSRIKKQIAALIGCASIGLSAAMTIIISYGFMVNPPASFFIKETYWTWFRAGGFSPAISLCLDSLSIVYIFIITFVGFLIHLYSAEFMSEEEGFSRFFAYMNLFVGSMLILVLAGDLLLLYLGWEGVGLCSYLLIGFWYKDPENGWAARKAFIVTRIGDTAMAIGLFILINNFLTLDIQTIMKSLSALPSGTTLLAAALLLGGAVGKSAQLPLQTWLPDAMAGPSPVSALIHAATMVTAGVYLIARTHVLFEAAPVVMTAVAVIGALTLLIAGLSALVQTNIKKVLAYSTISQIGYMFLGLGTGAWSASVFHFMTHAFFKALLFLGAGAVILALHHEHDMFKMGGLRRTLPAVFWTYLIGGASLSALPVITAGFYSKDMILLYSFAGKNGNPLFYYVGVAGAFLTSLYTFRMIFITFFGEEKTKMHNKPGLKINLVLVVLAVLALAGGFIETPESLGNVHILSGFLATSLPPSVIEAAPGLESRLQWIASAASLLGILMAYILYIKVPALLASILKTKIAGITPFLYSGCGFDGLYNRLLVRPVTWFSEINKNDIFDKINRGIVFLNFAANRKLSGTQSGFLRWYALSIAIGVIIIIYLAVIL